MMTNLAFPFLKALSVDLYPSLYLPDFITNAKRALIESDAFLVFFGAKIARSVYCPQDEM